jgi:protein involved in polysaccharide export with SLBB domain
MLAVDGLTRLSSLPTELTQKASLRFVRVSTAAGKDLDYDLFLARRFGDLSQDPYIRPGDQIHIPAAGRIVRISGEVFRPGTYELLPEEHLDALISYYADGFTLNAVPQKMSLIRSGSTAQAPQEIRFISWEEDRAIALEDGDELQVDHKRNHRTAVFFEGALVLPGTAPGEEEEEPQSPQSLQSPQNPQSPQSISRIPYYFYQGETLGNASRNTSAAFSDVSDLAQAYILREGLQIPVDLEAFLFRNDYTADRTLQEGDVIVIPYRRYYTLSGEVIEAGDKPLSSLTRLSALATEFTDKASTRFVRIRSAAGKTRDYDLFLARRFGDLSQDPYIRPGDRIHIPAAGRIVSISGEVFRPGTYELLPEEHLDALISYYADGFTLNADTERIRLSRIHTLEGLSGETQFTSFRESPRVLLEDRDRIFVDDKSVNRPVVFFEGALSPMRTTEVEETSAEIEGTSKMEYPFYYGETLGNAVRAIRKQFTAVSDLTNGYILRGEEQIPVDLRPFLYEHDFSKDMALENGDTIIIPFKQYFVLVSGAVKAPGRYPYVPDRQAEYYINLAGGRDELLNSGRGIKVFDMYHKNLKLSDHIPPESMISVPVNTFTAKFNQFAPVITTILSLVSATLSILAITGVF